VATYQKRYATHAIPDASGAVLIEFLDDDETIRSRIIGWLIPSDEDRHGLCRQSFWPEPIVFGCGVADTYCIEHTLENGGIEWVFPEDAIFADRETALAHGRRRRVERKEWRERMLAFRLNERHSQ